MRRIINIKTFVVIGLLLIAGSFATVANASHAWGKYHWDKSTVDTTTNPLILGDNFNTSSWDDALSAASTDWNDWNGSVLQNKVAPGTSNAANCDPTSGQVELCNGYYGDDTGWLGIASIWITRGRSSHIVQGVVKVNDTYFNTPRYNSQAWRDYVVCQEVGHTFGLGHQDENFDNTNLGTCMDYTSDPDGTLSQLDNRHPNQHDYDMMTEIYAHLNSTDGGGGSGNGKGNNGGGKGKPSDVGQNINLNDPSEWGQAIKQDAQGRDSLFMRTLSNGQVLITHVIWAK